MTADKELMISIINMGSFKLGDFALKTGPLSPFYVDLRHMTSHPKVYNAVSKAIYKKMKDLNIKADTVCGVPYTAIPFASYICSHHEIPMLMRRKERKDYGTKKMVEGVINPGETCLVFEDVVVSGASIIDTVADLRKEGLVITDCITILDRLQGGQENLLKMGIKLHSLFTIKDLFSLYCSLYDVEESQIKKVHKRSLCRRTCCLEINQHVHSCQYSIDVTVRKCKDVFPPIDGSVKCSHGNIWGSKCHFNCSSNFELQGHHAVVCEEFSNEVAWSSAFPKCKKIPQKHVLPIKNLPCLKPHSPSDGTVVCDSNEKTMYPDGSVCQFFCYPGFLIENLLTQVH
ncbi:uridine 5'-monophosphate synthase [Caerostris extrusa]|uniref:Uridine 5'-monophosphate synthase n=1 Tax=Caerostris extrusa TaxID=172846 RepID=A0AAV4NFB0_CAEEX|nr:uridine 5'-monophosphate synthase [Caerostris extrusa]